MNKKKSIISLIIIVVVLLVVFLSLLFIKLKPSLLNNSGNNEIGDKYTEANIDNIKTPEISGPMVPQKVLDINNSNSEVKESVDEKIIESKEASLLNGSVLQKEQVIIVNEKSFSPKEINVIYQAKVPLVLKANDENSHEITIKLEENEIKLPFSKLDGDLIYNFSGPKPGNYEFYIDNPENKGIIISVENK